MKLMKVGFLKDGMIQTMFPYLTIAAFVSLMLLGTNSFQIQFEKGIEIVRSRGYMLVGDFSLSQFTGEGVELVEAHFTEFIGICEAMDTDAESLTVYSDLDSKILFLIQEEENDGIRIFYCRFN